MPYMMVCTLVFVKAAGSVKDEMMGLINIAIPFPSTRLIWKMTRYSEGLYNDAECDGSF